MVFANWNQADAANFSCANYGCSGELLLATVSAGASKGASFNGPYDLGVVATGPPAVACEHSNTFYECQVLFTGEGLDGSANPHRNVSSFVFCLGGNGTPCGTTAVQDTGGWTDTPIGLTFNGPTLKGEFVGMVTEANPEGYLAFIEKPLVSDAWSSWQPLEWCLLGCFLDPMTHLGPTIKVREADENYDVIFAQ